MNEDRLNAIEDEVIGLIARVTMQDAMIRALLEASTSGALFVAQDSAERVRVEALATTTPEHEISWINDFIEKLAVFRSAAEAREALLKA